MKITNQELPCHKWTWQAKYWD